MNSSSEYKMPRWLIALEVVSVLVLLAGAYLNFIADRQVLGLGLMTVGAVATLPLVLRDMRKDHDRSSRPGRP